MISLSSYPFIKCYLRIWKGKNNLQPRVIVDAVTADNVAVGFLFSCLSECFTRNNTVQKKIKSLTHWGQVTHICVSKLTIIGSYNGLWPGRRQAIVWTNAGILLIGRLGTNFNEILIEIHAFSFKEIQVVWKMAAILFRPQCVNI